MISEALKATAKAQAHINGKGIDIYRYNKTYLLITPGFVVPKEAILLATVDRNGEYREYELEDDGISDISSISA